VDATASPPPPASTPAKGHFQAMIDQIRGRVVAGLLFMLPIAITFWIISYVYAVLRGLILDPLAQAIRYLIGVDPTALPRWWVTYASPVLAALLALTFLYLLGYLVRTWFFRALDWILLRVPLVAVIYKAVRNLFHSLGSGGGGLSFKRVVLVEFPHVGSRGLAFVTKTLREPGTGETILCVWVLTGVMPPAGFVLFVREKDVIDVPWSVNETLQVILSGGITAPAIIPFYQDSPGGLILPDRAPTLPEQ
jgi:uncharacterized membrane protein